MYEINKDNNFNFYKSKNELGKNNNNSTNKEFNSEINEKQNLKIIKNFMDNIYIKLNKKFKNNIIDLLNKKKFIFRKEVIKYNKKVYINSIIEKSKREENGKKRRISKFRGVSKNGRGWQTIMMSKNNKSYLGTFYSEELAARIYDIESIK